MNIDVPRSWGGGFQVYRLARGALESVPQKQGAIPLSIIRGKKKKTFKHEIDPGRQSEQAVRLTFALVRRINGNLQQVPRLEALQSARVEDLVVHLPDW